VLASIGSTVRAYLRLPQGVVDNKSPCYHDAMSIQTTNNNPEQFVVCTRDGGWTVEGPSFYPHQGRIDHILPGSINDATAARQRLIHEYAAFKRQNPTE
jgi:hypothetical protein